MARNTTLRLFIAWMLAGTLDISTAVVYYVGLSSAGAVKLLQGIASGLLGSRAFDGGATTAALGLSLHYLIALIWTLVLFVAFRTVRALRRQLVLTGIVYGLVVWFVMTFVVLPLSNVHRSPLRLQAASIAALILVLCIGLPLSLVIGRQMQHED